MADKPITTEAFHTKLVGLVADIAAKAIRGDDKDGIVGGIDWGDAEAVINLVFSAVSARASIFAGDETGGAGADVFVDVELTDADGETYDAKDGSPCQLCQVDLYASLIEEAEKRHSDPFWRREGDAGRDYATQMRDGLRGIADRLDAWLVAHPPTPHA